MRMCRRSAVYGAVFVPRQRSMKRNPKTVPMPRPTATVSSDFPVRCVLACIATHCDPIRVSYPG